MTREDRWIVTLDEIAALRWTCGRCKAAVSFPLDRTITLPPACANCGVRIDWPELGILRDFVESLMALRRPPRPHAEDSTLALEFIHRHREPTESY